MEQDAQVVCCFRVSGLLDENLLEYLAGLFKFFHATQRDCSTDVKLEITRLSVKDCLQLLLSHCVVLEVQSHGGEILAGIHELRICSHGRLEHGNCPLDVILFQVNEPEQVENRSVVGVDAQRALANEVAHVQLVLLEVGDGHIEIGIKVVRVPEQSNAAVLDGFIKVAFIEGFARVVVAGRGTVLVHAQCLVNQAFGLLWLAPQGSDYSQLGHRLRETGVLGKSLLEVLVGLLQVVQAQVKDAQVVDGLDEPVGPLGQPLEFQFNRRPGLQHCRVSFEAVQGSREFCLRASLGRGGSRYFSRCGRYLSRCCGRFSRRRCCCGRFSRSRCCCGRFSRSRCRVGGSAWRLPLRSWLGQSYVSENQKNQQ